MRWAMMPRQACMSVKDTSMVLAARKNIKP
jgi:hypothetical protein